MTTGRTPLLVRLYAAAARALSDFSGDAADAFAALYADERRRGIAAAVIVWLRAMIDLARAAIGARWPHPWRAIGQDVRWSVRRLLTRPAVSAAIILSIGLAIGANTAAFSVINAFMLRSWGSDDIDRVVRVREDFAKPGQAPDVRGFSQSSYGPWLRGNTVFEAMAAGTGANAPLMIDGRVERVAAGIVTANFFEVIGVRPVIGRTFTAEEDAPARRDAVILGDTIWRTRFAADPNVLGRRVELNGRARVVVGVMPRGFKHPYQSDVWVPLGYREDPANTNGIYVPARLKPGVTLAQANTELDAMARRAWEANPAETMPTGAQVTPLRPEMLGRLTHVLYGLGAAAMLVLLIATANVSNLLLAQSLEHQAEAAVRAALGASRGRLIRQFLTYSLILSALGGAIGVLLTFWSVGPLVGLSPLYGAGEFDIEPRLDAPTLAFTIALTSIVGIVFGVLPSLRASRTRATDVLRESGRSGTLSAGSRAWLKGLVVIELALAFVLLIGTALMAQGLLAMHRDTWGVDRQNVLTFDVAFAGFRYPERGQREAFVSDLLTRVSHLPGVTAAGATSTAPFDPGTEGAAFNVEGVPPPARGAFAAHTRTITPGYLRALGIPIVAGRDFDDRDAAAAPPVVIVSQTLANRYWPHQTALGRRVKRGPIDGPAPWMQVVGVAGAVRENADDGIPAGDAWYLPYRQPASGGIDMLTVAVKTASAPVSLLPTVRAAVAAIDPQQPISDAVTLEERFARFTATERLSALLTAALGAMGLFLAALGIYAVLAFSLSRRLPELGIRAALGARPADVRALVLREAAGLLAAGVATGGVVAIIALPMIDADLFPIGVSTPVAVVVALVGVALAALISSLMPAARAARVNPIGAMRSRG